MRSLVDALGRAPRSRRMMGLGVVSVAAVLGLGYAMGAGVGGSSSCVDGADRLEEIWGPSTRTELHEAFLRTGLPHAEIGWSTASGSLDDFAAAWKAVHLQACELPSGPQGGRRAREPRAVSDGVEWQR